MTAGSNGWSQDDSAPFWSMFSLNDQQVSGSLQSCNMAVQPF